MKALHQFRVLGDSVSLSRQIVEHITGPGKKSVWLRALWRTGGRNHLFFVFIGHPSSEPGALHFVLDRQRYVAKWKYASFTIGKTGTFAVDGYNGDGEYLGTRMLMVKLRKKVN